MADASTNRLNALAQATYGLDINGAARQATGLDLDLNGICQFLWGKQRNEAFDELSGLLGGHALLLDGTSGSFVSTPDAAALDITGDIDLRIELEHFPASQGSNRMLFSKWGSSNNSYRNRIIPFFNNLQLSTSTDGADSVNSNSTGVPLTGAIRQTLDVDDGASGRVVTTYTADTMDDAWNQVAQDTIAGATSIFAGTAELRIGVADDGSNPFEGRITRAEIRDGIDGTVVANPDFRDLEPGTTSFTDGAGRLWTLQGGAVIV